VYNQSKFIVKPSASLSLATKAHSRPTFLGRIRHLESELSIVMVVIMITRSSAIADKPLRRPTLVHVDVPCFAVKSCFMVNDCDLLASFFRLLPNPLPFVPSMREIPPANGFTFGMGKLEWRGYNLVKVHDERLSCFGTIHQRDRHTQTDRQDSHVAIANTAPTRYVGRPKRKVQ